MSTSPSPAEPQAAIDSALATLRSQFQSRFAASATEQSLREENAKILGKKGELTAILKQMGSVPPEARKTIGEKVNLLKQSIETAFNERLGELARAKRRAELELPPFDLTLPGRELAHLGHKHPLSIVREEVCDIFRSLGFAVHDGPEVELEENNFTKLGFPPDHPATDMQDSFWTADGHLLRTHTSNVQIRAMSEQRPPMAFIAPGAVYRRDDDLTHSPMFHQIEGFLVDEHVTLADLKGVLSEFAERLYGAGTSTRFRPSYFPFTEPSAEMDVACVFCKGTGSVARDGDRSRRAERPDERVPCGVCKKSGWMEILGCGMIHPFVFESCGIDPEKWTGFAFGMGIERIAMLRYGIPDIRLLFENDPRFLAQF